MEIFSFDNNRVCYIFTLSYYCLLTGLVNILCVFIAPLLFNNVLKSLKEMTKHEFPSNRQAWVLPLTMLCGRTLIFLQAFKLYKCSEISKHGKRKFPSSCVAIGWREARMKTITVKTLVIVFRLSKTGAMQVHYRSMTCDTVASYRL